ncbi:MAG: M20 family metallopeptidase [Gemmiger sp.]
MNAQELLKEAQQLQPELQNFRRELHRHPEVGFELTRTKAFVKQHLTGLGYEPQDCGKCGVVALAGGKKPGPTILIRGDMDALPIVEEADVDYRSEEPGKMHGCGHDMHTAMMLGAAKLLKEHEDELQGTVKLMFQPAEEIFQGADDMIRAGVLENPHVDAAAMIHVVPGLPLPSGTVLVPAGGTGMASCEQYRILVKGKGGHGAMPHVSVDPITAAAHIHLALQEINSRELSPDEFGVFTTGMFRAGEASNIIPDTAEMRGTIRTADLKVNEKIKTRMKEICEGVGKAMRTEVTVEFSNFCPPMLANDAVADCAMTYMKELMGDGALSMAALGGPKVGGGSEDFAFVSCKVPTVGMFLATGSPKDGFCYSQHHPKVKFDDGVLYRGSAAYAYLAARWLEDHS